MTPYQQLLRRKLIQILGIMSILMNMVTVLYSLLLVMGVQIEKVQQLECRRNVRKYRSRLANLDRLVSDSDVLCRKLLRMDRRTFSVLCEMVRDIGGLTDTDNMSLRTNVALFLYLLAHPKDNRLGGNLLLRSGRGRKMFYLCLDGILKLHQHLLKNPSPITEDCEDDRWKCFKNCLGALDNTFIDVVVPNEDNKGRFQTRKGTISMNVLGACTPSMEFVYVLSGWEGSAEDDRVLRSAISRPNGLSIPQGCYYLVDTKHCNYEGFLAPYSGHPYVLKEWQGREPVNVHEYFNKKHSEARNVIVKCFNLLKERWAILNIPSFFPVRTRGRIVLASALLHNLIRKHMPDEVDVGEEDEDEEEEEEDSDDEEDEDIAIDTWGTFRDTLALNMFHH